MPSPDPESLSRFRDQRVRVLVRHAYERVAHYRELFDRHRVDPRDVRGVSDLVYLPVTCKRDLQDRSPADLVARGIPPQHLIARRTTGSTGQPLVVRRTWSEERLLGALRWRTLRALGSRWSDRYAEIEELAPEDANDFRSLHRLAQACGLLRQGRFDALATPARIARWLVEYAPHVVSGYAGVLARIADAVEPTALAHVRPRFVAAHSDTLTGRMRATINEAFDAPVYEIYDANEFNVIAWQCRETGVLHVRDDSVVLETLDNEHAAAPNERLPAVITGLHSFAMPLLRYRIGDLVTRVAGACACGQPYSTIGGVQGRMFDYFPLVDGRVVHPYEIIAILEQSAPWLVRYQMIQEARDRVCLTVAARAEPPSEDLTTLHQRIGAFLGSQVALQIEVVGDLPATGAAGQRVCRSFVASEYEVKR